MILLLLFFLLLPANAATVTNGGTTISNFRNLEFNGSVTLTGNQSNGYALVEIIDTDSGGTVTSVAISGTNGMLSTGGPITTSGTIDIALDQGQVLVPSAIGSTVQAWDEHLDDIAAITPGAENRIITSDGLGSWTVVTFSSLDTNANTICTGTTTYLDGEGNCDDISSVYQAINTQYAFKTVSTTSGSAPVADSNADTLTLTAGTGISITGSSGTDTVTIANTAGSEWTDTGTILHPNESAADEIAIGGTTEAGADIFLGADGSAVFNEQGTAGGLHFRIEGSGQPNLFDVDYSNVGIGIGGAASPSYLLQVSGNTNVVNDLRVAETIYLDAEVDDGNSSTADTIDWGTGNHHKSTMTGNCTYTFTAPGGPTTMTLKLVQSSGSNTATWPATVKWPGGTAPTLSTAASAIDFISCYYDGTNYYCSEGLDFQ